MPEIGLGIILRSLFDDNTETVKALKRATGHTIRSAEIIDKEDGELVLKFDDFSLSIRDEGRSCCESRYITTDDDLASFVGAEFKSLELRDGPVLGGEWGPHEQQFLLVNTSLGTFTVVTHNEHNGYYGGFFITARITEKEKPCQHSEK